VLAELHVSEASGYFGGDTTCHKVLRVEYYWPTLVKDAHMLSRKCVIYQKATRRVKNASFPLQTVTVDAPFHQWGLEIIGLINPCYSQ
jgi:hypothetical protein